MKKKITTFILISIIIVSVCCLYLYYENNFLKVSNYIISSEKIPNDFENYKIIQISDFHNTKSKKLTDDLVRKIEKNQPNLIVITGDLVDATKTDIDTAINFIFRINEFAPIYYVTGNHEASISRYDELEAKLISNKVTILDDKAEIIKINDSEINLIGINDPKFSSNSYTTDSTIINDSLKPIEYDKNNFTILLSHRPELFETYVENNINLVLTGHAHGGQIRIPFIGGLVAPNQGLFPEYTSGKFEKNNTTMVISRGIGNSIIPYRINNRPEMVVVTLSSE